MKPLLLFLTLSLALEAAALRGRVTDPSGAPARAATLQLLPESGGETRSAVADEEGRYLFANLPPGRYRIMAAGAGLTHPLSAAFAVAGDSERDVALAVAPLRQTLIVSGSRVTELQEDSPTKVEAVTRDQILSTGYERVSDVLSETPGVVTRSGSSATVGGEQIWGVDSRQVLLLQDGLPIIGARGIKSGVVNLNRQDIGKLERVEIAKGAAAALYGSDAIGGAINLITREPVEPFELGATISGGTLGTLDSRMDIGGRWDKLSVYADIEDHRMDAYRLLPTSTVSPDFHRYEGLGKVRYQFSPRVAVGFTASAYHNRQVGVTTSGALQVQGTSNDSLQSYALVGDLLPTNSTTVQLRAYASRYDENSRSDNLGTNTPSYGFANLNERYQRLDGTVSQQLGAHNLLQGGYEWVQNLYRGANRLVGDNAGQQVTTNDVWLQNRFQPTSRLTLTIGGRVQHHSLYGAHPVPKAGLVYRLSERWVVRASYGKGFRAPDLGQLYFRFANPSSFYQVIGNPTLRTETSTSYSAGVAFRARRFRGGVTLFRNDLNDLIDSYNIGTPTSAAQLQALLVQYGIPANFEPLVGRQTFVYLNLNRAYTQGFEMDAEYAVGYGFRVQGSYTFLRAEDRATGLQLPQRHKHQGFFKTEYVNARRGVTANVRGTFFSKWPLNPAQGTYGLGYQIWDAYLSQRLPGGVTAFGAIDNLADSRDAKLSYATPTFDRPDYGRTFRTGLRYQWQRRE